MPTYGMLDHGVVSCDDKGSVLEEQEQPNGFECGDRSLRQAPVEIVNQNDQSYLHGLQGFFERFPESMNLFGWGGFFLCCQQPASRLANLPGYFFGLSDRVFVSSARKEFSANTPDVP